MTEVLRRGTPGLKSVKDLPVRQDGPPPGGFFPIRFGKRIPNAGPAGTTMLIATLGVMTYGWIQLSRNMDQWALEKDEKRRARMALVPTLAAERDVRVVEYQREWNKLEAKIMEDVPGWEVGKNVYKTVNYMPPMLQYHPIRRLSTHH